MELLGLEVEKLIGFWEATGSRSSKLANRLDISSCEILLNEYNYDFFVH